MLHMLWIIICIVAVMIFLVGIAGESVTLFSVSKGKEKDVLKVMFGVSLALMVALIVLLLGYVGVAEM